MRMKILPTLILFSLLLVTLVSGVTYTQDYNNFLTRSIADQIYCQLNKNCNISMLTVVNITVIDKFFNATTIVGLNESIEAFSNTTFLRLDTQNDPLTNDLNLGENNLNNASNITASENYFIGDTNHFLRQEYPPINSIAGSAMMLVDTGAESEGEILFSIIHAPNDNITNLKIIQCNQVGRNNSFSCFGNSMGVIRNDICTANPRFNNGTHCNMSAITDYLIQCEVWNKSCEYFADTAGRDGPLLWTQGDLEVWRTANIMEGIRVSLSADFINTDLDILNGSLHSQIPVSCELGTEIGVERNLVDERFLGNLGVFNNLQVDAGDWHANSDARCDSDECANANGISGVGNLIMQTNFSTLDFNQTGVSFVYSLTKMIAASSFTVTINNNSGSGDVTLFTDSTDDVLLSEQFIELDSDFTNATKVSLNFECDVTKIDRECFVDTVIVNGSHTINSTFTESRIASETCFGTGERGADGRCEFGEFWEPCNQTLVIRGNVTETSITTISETILEDLTVGGDIILRGNQVNNTNELLTLFWSLTGNTFSGRYTSPGLNFSDSGEINGSGNFNIGGNVGIGTTTPLLPLHVIGNGIINNLTTDFINSIKNTISIIGNIVTHNMDINCTGDECIEINTYSFTPNGTKWSINKDGILTNNHTDGITLNRTTNIVGNLNATKNVSISTYLFYEENGILRITNGSEIINISGDDIAVGDITSNKLTIEQTELMQLNNDTFIIGKGLMLSGVELINDTLFDNPSDWDTSATNWAIQDGLANHSGGGGQQILNQSNPFDVIAGEVFFFDVKNFVIGATCALSIRIGSVSTSLSGSGSQSGFITATNSDNFHFFGGCSNAAHEVTIESVSVRRLNNITMAGISASSLQVSGDANVDGAFTTDSAAFQTLNLTGTVGGTSGFNYNGVEGTDGSGGGGSNMNPFLMTLSKGGDDSDTGGGCTDGGEGQNFSGITGEGGDTCGDVVGGGSGSWNFDIGEPGSQQGVGVNGVLGSILLAKTRGSILMAGGFGNTGVTIDQDGNVSIDGNTLFDGDTNTTGNANVGNLTVTDNTTTKTLNVIENANVEKKLTAENISTNIIDSKGGNGIQIIDNTIHNNSNLTVFNASFFVTGTTELTPCDPCPGPIVAVNISGGGARPSEGTAQKGSSIHITAGLGGSGLPSQGSDGGGGPIWIAGGTSGGQLNTEGGPVYIDGGLGSSTTHGNVILASVRGEVWVARDNAFLYFGAGDTIPTGTGDASISYDNTNLVINPDIIGSGFVDVQGSMNIDNFLGIGVNPSSSWDLLIQRPQTTTGGATGVGTKIIGQTGDQASVGGGIALNEGGGGALIQADGGGPGVATVTAGDGGNLTLKAGEAGDSDARDEGDGGDGGSVHIQPRAGGASGSSSGSPGIDGVVSIGDGGITNYMEISRSGDITWRGSAGDITGTTSFQGKVIIDITDIEALLVRKNSDGGDIFNVDTTNSKVKIGGTLNATGNINALNLPQEGVTATSMYVCWDTDGHMFLNETGCR